MFVWLLPLLWAISSWFGFEHPGDEYALWGLSSFPGLWILFVVNEGDVKGIRLPVVLAGAASTALLGWIMDRVRVSIRWWIPAVILAALLLAVSAIRSHPSYQRAMSKNGSLAAYLFAASTSSLSIVSIAAVPTALVAELLSSRLRRTSKTRPEGP